MRKITVFILIINALIIGFVATLTKNKTHEDALDILKRELSQEHIPGVDHSKFGFLQCDFDSPHAVTEACICCHTERADEMIKTAHFLWSREEYIEGRGVVATGKKNLINNYCISIGSSEELCNKCHAGYGYGDKEFDFTAQRNVDCLVCHDNSGRYAKKTEGSGYPKDNIDLSKVAQSVGRPQKSNCGACHFMGGGGNNVKHGDLEIALLSSDQQVDVHMGYDGINMECSKCHSAKNHKIKGKMYSVSSMDRERASCSDCHTAHPHKDGVIDGHTIKVACQSCHIPTYAKVNATITHWDWSTAGKLRDGKSYSIDDEDGNHLYYSKKGTFTWGKNLTPDYVWFNGTADHYFLGEEIDPNQVTKINTLNGSYADVASKIIPVKIHHAKQIYDTKTRQLIAPALHGPKGSGAFWSDFDFDASARRGMDYKGLEYSGEYGFTDTEMYWPINHMVSKSENALSCTECHSKNGRLAKLTDFYLPGRDSNPYIEKAGISLVLLTLLGVVIHGVLRILHSLNRRRKS